MKILKGLGQVFINNLTPKLSPRDYKVKKQLPKNKVMLGNTDTLYLILRSLPVYSYRILFDLLPDRDAASNIVILDRRQLDEGINLARALKPLFDNNLLINITKSQLNILTRSTFTDVGYMNGQRYFMFNPNFFTVYKHKASDFISPNVRDGHTLTSLFVYELITTCKSLKEFKDEIHNRWIDVLK